MKKTLLIALLALAGQVSISAEEKSGSFARFGITGGFLTMQSVSDMKANGFDKSGITDYNAGITIKFKDIRGLSIQPSLVYTSKTNVVGTETDAQQVKNQYLQLPVQMQYGSNIFGFRPYLFAEPYVAYCFKAEIKDVSEAAQDIQANWSGFSNLEYGVGLGIGVTLWTIQLAVRYSWAIGTIGEFDWERVKREVGSTAVGLVDSFRNNKTDDMFNGLTVTAAIFF